MNKPDTQTYQCTVQYQTLRDKEGRVVGLVIGNTTLHQVDGPAEDIHLNKRPRMFLHLR